MLAHLRHRVATATATTLLALSSFSVSNADAPIGSDRPKPASVTTVGTMRVERYGSGTPAIVFIPGLDCGSWVWDDTVRAFSPSHALYVVTLAGFDGLAAPTGPVLDLADQSLLQLLTTQHLERPVIVGHSLGGFLALRFGTEHSSLVRGIVAVDGTPVFPTLAATPPDQRTATASAIAGKMRAATPAEYAAQSAGSISAMVTDPTKASQITQLAAKSDRGATTDYMQALLAADLRPQLANLTAPTLELAPVPTTPAPYEGPQAASATMEQRAPFYQDFYAGLFTGAPHVRVVTIPNSRHFIMIDQPQAFDDALRSFIATLPS